LMVTSTLDSIIRERLLSTRHTNGKLLLVNLGIARDIYT
jgi:hypothetical protein